MAHAVETLAWTGEPPWHKLGKNVTANLSPMEMQIEAGLDWKVEKVPLHYQLEGSREPTPTGQFALVRRSDNSMLDIVKSNRWEPVQNEQAFEFFENFVSHNHMSMEVAGSLKGGKLVFVLAKMNHAFNVGYGDRTEAYLLFTNPHQYGQAVDIRLTPIRVVCQNTLSLALQTASNAMIKHNHRTRFNVEGSRQVVDGLLSLFYAYSETAQYLATKRYKHEPLRKYFEACFPLVPNIHTKTPSNQERSTNAERALEVVEKQPGGKLAPGTWWNALNAVTYLTDHEIGKQADTRLHAAWYGRGEKRKKQALELAVEFAKAA